MCRLAIYYALYLLFRSSSFGCLTFARAGEVNITVDDTDASVVYHPDTAWFFNKNSSQCTFCLTPPSPTIAYNNTWHHGLHVIPTRDADDEGDHDHDDLAVDHVAPAMRLRRGLVIGRRNGDNSAYDPTNGATTSPFVTNKLDSDDASFVDFPVSVQFNFTGSAIYLFCVLPLGVPPNTNSTPTLMNLTFTLDGEPAGSFLHNGSTNTGGFQSSVPVLSRGNLSNSAHNLLINLGPNSVFLLDHYAFTRSDIGPPSTPATGIISESTAISKNKHEVQTFAGAVGGSVGVLAVISACVAISIYRRRRRSARQELRDREHQSDAQSFHTDASDDPPSMQGPTPFIPRYFPGTVPLAPPPYIGPPSIDGPAPLSYHIPPHRAPPAAALDAAHDTEPLDIPPSFSVAVSSSEPPILANPMHQTIRRIPPPRLVEDGQSVLPDVAHLPPTDPIVLPPRSPQSTHSDTPPFSPTPSAAGSEAEAPLSRAASDHGVRLDT